VTRSWPEDTRKRRLGLRRFACSASQAILGHLNPEHLRETYERKHPEAKTMPRKAPLNDTIIVVMGRMVDDAQTETRDLSHYDLEDLISRAGLGEGDPKSHGQVVGKSKRVRATLNWALQHHPEGGEALVASLVSSIQGYGGFRNSSANYVGAEVMTDAVNAFRDEGFTLTLDGDLRAVLLDNLSGCEMSSALRRYVTRARRGADDAALVTGTGKDLLEATAAHVLVERWGSYSTSDNFSALLGKAFIALELKVPQDPVSQGELYNCRLERALFEAACAVNTLRNKQGTGHGHPWLPNVTESESRRAVQVMGLVAELLLDALEEA
jgi:hypothetical protein